MVSIADAGIKLSCGLFSLAQKVKYAEHSIQLISNDVSATCGILSQLENLIKPKEDATGKEFVIFNEEGSSNLRASRDECQYVFNQLKEEVERASKQFSGKRRFFKSNKIELSTAEKAKWSLLEPKILRLRSELGKVKSNIVLILSIAHLAHAENLREQGTR